jgi:hypothetical protein
VISRHGPPHDARSEVNQVRRAVDDNGARRP